jgi:choline dehydrogenase-like flavoprotein
VALATRLSQSLPDHSILLVEAGPIALEENKINIPGMKGSTIGTSYDWNFTSIAQPGANGRVLSFPRGKVLGGSSALNLMVWNRASVAEYDAWEELGNPGWNWDSMKSAMIKSENFTNLHPEDSGVAERGTNGPVHNIINRFIPVYQKFWVPTLEALGLSHNLESLGGDPLGVMYQPSSIKSPEWERSYSANAYLPEAGSNLDLLLETQVSRINLEASDTGDTKATGVTLQNGTVITARNEVILSAGSIQSPGLLELSGIGQKSVLDAAGITQIIDLPGVGENLQDHPRISLVYQLTPNYTSFDELRLNATYASEQLALWFAGNLSRYDYTGSGISLLNWKQAVGNDSELVSLARDAVGNSTNVVEQKKLTFITDDSVAKTEIIFSDGNQGLKGYPAQGTPLYGQSFLTIIPVLMHHLSRGSVHITSSNITDHPTFNPNYLSTEYDLQAVVEMVKYSRRIAQTEPMASAFVSEYEPGLDAVSTEEELVNFAKSGILTVNHPACTCPMLPKKDGGVVDPRLRVWGTTNLRVVDASIIPVLIASHIQTAVYGIAERAAEMIVEDCKDL